MSIYAKTRFCQAMKELMMEKSLRQVKVTEIIEQAGLSRQAFYLYFKDKYELAAYFWEHEISSALSIFEESKGLYEITVQVLRMMQTEQRFYNNLLKDIDEQNSFFKFYFRFCMNHTIHHAGLIENNPAIQFALKMYVYGSIMCIREWLEMKCPEKPEDLAHKMVSSVPAIMTPYTRY